MNKIVEENLQPRLLLAQAGPISEKIKAILGKKRHQNFSHPLFNPFSERFASFSQKWEASDRCAA